MNQRVSLVSACLFVFVILVLEIPFSNSVFAEDVIFIVPGSSDARVPDFDPLLQIIEKNQRIVFVNADGLGHHLVVLNEDGEEVFDTGKLEQNQFVSYTFSEYGEYSIHCKIYPGMTGQISVTDDIATFTKSIEGLGMDVQLSRSPATVGVNDEVYYKVTFISKETGRNHPHIDYTLTFNDSSSNYVDGMGGHTVDGQEVGVFQFNKEDSFTPTVTISGVDFTHIGAETVTFETLVTPEFSPVLVGVLATSMIGAILFYNRTANWRSRQ